MNLRTKVRVILHILRGKPTAYRTNFQGHQVVENDSLFVECTFTGPTSSGWYVRYNPEVGNRTWADFPIDDTFIRWGDKS